VIHLIHTLVHQQHCLVIRPKKQSREGALSECYGAPLDFEAFFDRGVDLRLGG
jgi:hypothetical protein